MWIIGSRSPSSTRRGGPPSAFLCLACCLVANLAGCGWFSGDKSGESGNLPKLGEATNVAEVTKNSAGQDDAPAQKADSSSGKQPGTSEKEKNTSAKDKASKQETASLQLELQQGDRFPLLKTVEQTVSQSVGRGSVLNRSRLELLLEIEVDNVRKNRILLSVRYHRVRFTRIVDGERIEYDSESPPNPVPLEVQAYHGLVDNGFSFWLGPDNRIVELAGFRDFLERCVREVPPDRRQQVLRRLAATTGDEGIANFVDDSIGLLPYGEAAEEKQIGVGSHWTRERQVVQPTPMYLSSRCTLTDLDETTANIEIVGNITPSATYGPADGSNRNVRLKVHGGHTFGNCTVQRETGLPLDSRIERYIDMTVQLPDGAEFEQQKRLVTTIRAFPQQGTAARTPRQQAARSENATLSGNAPERQASDRPRGSSRR